MKIFIDVIKFAFSVFILYYLPGYFFVRILKNKLNLWKKVVLSFSAGLIIIPQVYSYLEIINLHNFFLIFVLMIGLIYSICRITLWFLYTIKERKFKFHFKLSREKAFLCGIILVILVIASLAIGTSGLVYNNGMRFYQANAYDSVGQLAMVEELTQDSSHEFPFYSGLLLRGYHVGAFYWRAIVQKITRIDSIDLFFRFCPLFLFPLIILMSFVSIENLMKNSYIALLATFFIFLMSDLSWVFPVIDRLLPFKDIQTVKLGGTFLHGLMFNPPLAHGVLIFFMGCYFLKNSYTERDYQRRMLNILFTGFLFGSLFEYKSFVWAVVFAALILTGIKEYFFDKKSLLLKISLVAIAFSALSFFRTVSKQTLSLFKFNLGYYPLSIFRQMGVLSSEARISLFIILLAFLFYLTGALGIKIVGFYKIYQYLKAPNRISSVILFLLLSMAFSFIFTHSLLLESNYFYATYNFFTIFLLLISIFAACVIVNWAKNLRLFLKVIVFLIIFIIGIGSTTFSLLGFFPKYSKYKVIPEDTLEAVDYIKGNTEEDVVILHNVAPRCWLAQRNHQELREGRKGRDSFISSLTQRRIVCECTWHMEIGRYAEDLNQRENDIKLFFDTMHKDIAIQILDRYGVDYVWVEKGQKLNFEKGHILEMVFSNPQIQIYKRIHL